MVAPDEVLAPHLLDRHFVARLRVRVEPREPNGADGIQEARALRQRVVAGVRLRGVLQDRLHGIGRQARVRLDHQGDRAGNDRRRHAGAAQAQVRQRGAGSAGDQRRGAVDEEVAALRRERHGARARRDQVRLGVPVDVGRTARAEAADHVVGPLCRALRARATDGQHPGRVARRADAAVLRQPRRVLAEVAGGADHHDAGVDDALGREGQRVGPGRFVNRRAHRHVDDADVVGSVVGEDPVQRGDDVADRAVAVAVEHLQRNQVRLGRRAAFLAVRIVAVARDDAGDVRAVPVVVVRRGVPVDEVDELHHALVAVGIQRAGRTGQVVMPAGDAGVDDRDADARPGEAQRVANDLRAHRQRRAVVELGRRPVVVQAEHRRVHGEFGEEAIRQFDGEPVDDAELPVALRILHVLRRQRGARLQLDDYLRLVRRISPLGAERQLVIELVRLDVGVGTAGDGFAALIAVLTPFGHRARSQPQNQDGDGGEDPLRTPNGLLSRSRAERRFHNVPFRSIPRTTSSILPVMVISFLYAMCYVVEYKCVRRRLLPAAVPLQYIDGRTDPHNTRKHQLKWPIVALCSGAAHDCQNRAL